MAEYIGREAAIKCAEESYKMWNLTMAAADGAREINKCYKMQKLCKTIGEVFKIVPTAHAPPARQRRWLCVDTDIEQFFLCNRCKKKEYWESNYCPICGAKMDGN